MEDPEYENSETEVHAEDIRKRCFSLVDVQAVIFLFQDFGIYYFVPLYTYLLDLLVKSNALRGWSLAEMSAWQNIELSGHLSPGAALV